MKFKSVIALCLMIIMFIYTIYRHIPDQELHVKLSLAGLGEKRMCLVCDASSAQDLDTDLAKAYPKLADEGGGYELLRVSAERESRELCLIEMPANGYTAEYLRSVVSSTAKIFIRPIQRDLDLTAAAYEV